MHWELWDTDSGNLVGEYSTETEALAIVRDALDRHGSAVVATLALGAEYDEEGGADHELSPVIRGDALATRALEDSSRRAAGESGGA